MKLTNILSKQIDNSKFIKYFFIIINLLSKKNVMNTLKYFMEKKEKKTKRREKNLLTLINKNENEKEN